MLRFETISSEQMDRCVTDRHCLVIDVRDYKDYNRMHIENAICIPFEKLEKEYNKMPRDLILVLYCERGGRSLLAAKELYDRGDRKSTRLNSSHSGQSRMPSSA